MSQTNHQTYANGTAASHRLFAKEFPILAAVCTPFSDETGDVNLSVIPSFAKKLEERDCDGVFLSGTCGEGPSCTVEERKALMRAWAEACRETSSLKLIVHIGGSSVRDARELAEEAARLYAEGRGGIHGIAAVAPFYLKPANEEVLADCIAYIAQGAPHVPFFYYHFPDTTGVTVPLSAALPALMKKVPSLRGVKFTSKDLCDWAKASSFVRSARPHGDFYMWGGYEEVARELCIHGADGWIGAAAPLVATEYRDMCISQKNGAVQKAEEKWKVVESYLKVMDDFGCIQCLRVIFEDGWGLKGVGLAPRLPAKPLSSKDLSALRERLARDGLVA
uniref:N-acetylneuraminate lyase n=1 Tax=Chromera velia CCMP2878 TaxID=1169474 RepID=A0A0G4I4R8_9ALVE|eukprot:Cvel_10992.t1-p1 / transcript=Cvel_10992.t1 / gene=Cvel_10992 / organism=Chromera_velia_CCMP2878 / gene_product=N-acetylneuraminate lyase A, putative / transcript_product=N-acetylneuraminate lyase A, putative / location=Cvel_scaffold677:15975-20615(-) / protein_length=334 / sequence_SO=supercontig / SO=protein_coding / is_pseudo=false